MTYNHFPISKYYCFIYNIFFYVCLGLDVMDVLTVLSKSSECVVTVAKFPTLKKKHNTKKQSHIKKKY